MIYRFDDGSKIEIGWDIEGWDWANNDPTWLASHTSLANGGFFIHGGKVRHQKHIPNGSYGVAEFISILRDMAEGLENPTVRWSSDTGAGDIGLWLEGERAPTKDDALWLAKAKQREADKDKRDLEWILKKHPEWKQP